MEKQAEKQIEKVFVNVSQVWFKGEAISSPTPLQSAL